jgi:hypothetical protein
MAQAEIPPASPALNGRLRYYDRNLESTVKSDLWKPDTIQGSAVTFTDRAFALATTVAIGISGTLYLAGGAVLTPNVPVTSITFISGGTAIVNPTNQWFCLVDQRTLAVLGKTTDDTNAAWANNSPKTLNLSSIYTPTVVQPVYLGIVIVAATVNSMRGIAPGGGSPNSLTPVLAGNSTAGLTDPASLGATAGAITAANGLPYAYAS